MKKIVLIVALLGLITSCYKEDPINAKAETPRFNLADDPNDPLQHFIHTLHRDYGTILITDPIEEDYKFNFKFNNNLIITPPKQDKALLAEAVKFIEEIFVNVYNDEFKKTYFPYSIIFAQKMTNKQATVEYDAFGGSNFIAISNIDENLTTMTAERKSELRGILNGTFFGALSSARGLFQIPKEFDQISPANGVKNGYGYTLFTTPADNSELYTGGFTAPDSEETWAYIFPTSPQEDQKLWLQFIFKTPLSEVEEICANYPRMKSKYEILRATLAELGLDIVELAPKKL